MITQQRGTALGTTIAFTLRADETTANHTLIKMRLFMREYEQRFSRFLIGSELTALNTRAGEWHTATPEFLEFIQRSNHIQDWSQGHYNPFVLPDLQRAGYTGSLIGTHGRERQLDMTSRSATYTQARVKIRGNSCRIPHGTAFDSGGLGKGYALDKLADLVEAAGIKDYWIHLGGDVIGRGSDDSGRAFSVVLDMIDGCPVITLPEHERGAVATSSTRKRRGKDWHHLIDPRSGAPSSSRTQSVSVIARSGATADILAKSLLLADEAAEDLWQKTPATAAYLQQTHNVLYLSA